MTDEEKLCTALSLLLYGDCVIINKRKEEELNNWLIDDGVLNQGLFIRSEEPRNIPEGKLLDLDAESPAQEKEETQTLFLAPMPPPPPEPENVERLPDSPMQSGIFLRSNASDEWIIA